MSECDSNGDASKKTKVPEDQVGPGAVPDVADAIEDLLAQSSKVMIWHILFQKYLHYGLNSSIFSSLKIQDIKSPPQSGCDQTVSFFQSASRGLSSHTRHFVLNYVAADFFI